MRKLLCIFAIAPALASAELVVLNPELATPAAAPAVAAAPVGQAVAASPIVMSAALQVTAMREGNALVLLFREAPGALFVSDYRSGASLTSVQWLSDRSLRLTMPGTQEIEIRTPKGVAVLALEGIGVAVRSERRFSA